MRTWFLIILCAAPPDAFDRMIESRLALRRAAVDWSLRSPFDPLTQGAPSRQRSRLAESDYGLMSDGVDGVAGWTEDGKPVAHSRAAVLRRGSEYWDFRPDLVSGEMYPNVDNAGEVVFDFRMIGLLPLPATMHRLDRSIMSFGSAAPPRGFRERDVDGLREVCADQADREVTLCWLIDPARGWNPVRVEQYANGQLTSRCENELAQLDGVWFPVNSRYYDGVGNEIYRIEIESAVLDPSKLPAQLRPEDIGVGTGMTITVIDGDEGEHKVYVNDLGLVTKEEYFALHRQGTITDDPRIEQAAQRLRASRNNNSVFGEPASRPTASAPVVTPHISDDDWERYVREFVVRYKLNDEQTQNALTILAQCREKRAAHSRATRPRVDAIASKLIVERDREAAARLKSDIAELQAPIDRIFEENLKPRLERLPTRAQRAAAGDGVKP